MKKCLCLFLAFTLIFCLFGCKADKKTEHKATGNGLTWDDGYTPTQPGEEEEKDQDLTLVYYPDRGFNPYLCTDFTNQALFSAIYQGLFSVDRNYQVAPVLCKSYSMSEDMRTYIFYLEEATFSDGSPLTAQDVVASLNSAREGALYKGRFRHVDSINLTTDGGVVIQLDTAYENFPILLDVPILKASQLLAAQPVGTGPYRLDGSGGYLRLVRQREWWCEKEIVLTDAMIDLVVAESPNQIRDEFEFGDVDLVCADPGSDSYADYRCDYEVWEAENGIFLYLHCNMGSEVFTNEKVRSALTHAIDRDTLVAQYYRGFAHSATLPASPQSPYYNKVLAERYGYDSIKFAQAVSEAGLKGRTVVMLVNSDDSLRLRVGRAIAQMLKDCGLEVELLELGGYAYEDTLRFQRYGEWDLYLGQTKLSANMDLSSFFSATGALSWHGMDDTSFYALCLESLANKGNYVNLHQEVMEDGRLVPILFRSYAVYATRGVVTELTPTRDAIFHYSLGKTMEDALIEYADPVILPQEPEDEEPET